MKLVIYTAIILYGLLQRCNAVKGVVTMVEPSAKRPSASRVQRKARRAKAESAEHVYGVPVPEGLHDAIETERGNLCKAESVLGCLAIAMEYETDSANGPHYPHVAELVRELARQSINSSDSLVLQQRLLRHPVKERPDPAI